DEAVDLPVAVAGEVRDGGADGRLLVEPVDRHDREELLDRPHVGRRLEDREVAVVDVGHDVLEVLDLLGDAAQPAAVGHDLLATMPEDTLGLRALAERQIAKLEEALRLLLALYGVVVALLQVLWEDALPRLVE